MDPDSTILQIVILLVLIAINAFFAMSEIAIVTFNDNKLKKMAEDGNKRAAILHKMVSEPSKFLSTIQIGVTLAGFMAAGSAADKFSEPFAAFLSSYMPLPAAQTIALISITLLLAYFNLVLGELVPKRIAMHHPEKISLMVAPIIRFVFTISKPFVAVLSASTNLVLRLFGISADDQPEQVTEEEIRMMLAEGKEQGTIQKEESKMIQNVFEFNDTTAEQVSTRRRDLVCLNLEDDAQEWEKTIRECRFSHFPIIDSNQEDVVGILDTKDYFRSEDKSKEYVMKNAVDDPYFVPENMKANILFAHMKKVRIYFAVVLDEYGGMSGIVTLHDLVEALVGELEEEEMPAKPEDIKKIKEDVWRIQGCAQLDEVSEALGVEFPEVFDTFSGFVWDAIGRVPAEGEKFSLEVNDLKIDVKNIENHMVDYAIVRKVEKRGSNEADI